MQKIVYGCVKNLYYLDEFLIRKMYANYLDVIYFIKKYI